MKSIRFTPAAENDLRQIWLYSAQHWGAGRADEYTHALEDACRSVALGERQGRPVDIRPRLMKIAAGSHVLYFRDLPDAIEVIRILHRRQDVERNMLQPE